MTPPARASTPPTSSSGASTPSTRTNSARAEDAFFGAGAVPGRRRQDGRHPRLRQGQGETWFNAGVWTDHFIPTPEPDRQRPSRRRAASSARATWRSTKATPGSPAASRPPAPTKPVQLRLRRQPAGQRHDHVTAPRGHVQHPQDRPRSRTRPSRPLTAMVASQRAAHDVRRHAGRHDQAGRLVRVDRRALPRHQARLVRRRRPCSPTRTCPTISRGCPTTRRPKTAMQAFQNKYRTTSGVDIDAELDHACRRPSRASSTSRRRRSPELRPPSRSPRAAGSRGPASTGHRSGSTRWPPRRPSLRPADRGSARAAGSPRSIAARRSGAWSSSAPWIIGLLLFTAGPLIASLVLSFTDFNLVDPRPSASSAWTTTRRWRPTRSSGRASSRPSSSRSSPSP